MGGRKKEGWDRGKQELVKDKGEGREEKEMEEVWEERSVWLWEDLRCPLKKM